MVYIATRDTILLILQLFTNTHILSDPSKVKKVKVTLVQALRLFTGCTAHGGTRGIALLFHDHGTRRG